MARGESRGIIIIYDARKYGGIKIKIQMLKTTKGTAATRVQPLFSDQPWLEFFTEHTCLSGEGGHVRSWEERIGGGETVTRSGQPTGNAA